MNPIRMKSDSAMTGVDERSRLVVMIDRSVAAAVSTATSAAGEETAAAVLLSPTVAEQELATLTWW